MSNSAEHSRNCNYSKKEIEKLVALLEARKQIITKKIVGPTTWQEMNDAWMDIEKEFNNPGFGTFRNAVQLKTKYKALKRGVTKKLLIGSPLTRLELRVRVFMLLSEDTPTKKKDRKDTKRKKKKITGDVRNITTKSKKPEKELTHNTDDNYLIRDSTETSDEEPLAKRQCIKQNKLNLNKPQHPAEQLYVEIKKEPLEEDSSDNNEIVSDSGMKEENTNGKSIQNVWIKQEVDEELSSSTRIIETANCQVDIKIEPIKEESSEDDSLDTETAPSSSTQEQTIDAQKETPKRPDNRAVLDPVQKIEMRIQALNKEIENEERIFHLKQQLAKLNIKMIKERIQMYKSMMKHSPFKYDF